MLPCDFGHLHLQTSILGTRETNQVHVLTINTNLTFLKEYSNGHFNPQIARIHSVVVKAKSEFLRSPYPFSLTLHLALQTEKILKIQQLALLQHL